MSEFRTIKTPKEFRALQTEEERNDEYQYLLGQYTEAFSLAADSMSLIVGPDSVSELLNREKKEDR